MKIATRLLLFMALICGQLLVSGHALGAESYDGNRWFQIEVSIFSNDFPDDENSERWSPAQLQLGFPARTRRLESIADFLTVANLELRISGNYTAPVPSDLAVAPGIQPALTPEQYYIRSVGPPVLGPVVRFRIPDPERDPYVRLPATQSDFQQTNRALERSPQNRLLFHSVWRQPVLPQRAAPSIYIEGGQQYGDRHELEGSLTLRFNDGSDRVVIDANLWRNEFGSIKSSPSDWTLPPLPSLPPLDGSDADDNTGDIPDMVYVVNRVVQMLDSRDMRSNEFHYIDNPALGLVVSVKPYDLPPPLPTEEYILEPATGELETEESATGIAPAIAPLQSIPVDNVDQVRPADDV